MTINGIIKEVDHWLNEECICAEINARHCPVHNEPPINSQITKHLSKFDEEFPGSIHSELTMAGLTSKWQSNKDIKSFLTQALQSTWNAAVKDTVERTKLKYKTINPLLPFICAGYNQAVKDQNELIKKLKE